MELNKVNSLVELFFEKYKENVQIGENVIFVSQNGDISSILANGFVEQLNQVNIYHLKNLG